MTQDLKAMLIRHEGLKLKVYKDTRGILTIGVGRNLDDAGISFDEAMLLLENDVSKAMTFADSSLHWFPNLCEARQAVILSMIFNMGMGGLLQFKKFLTAMGAEDWVQAKNEMLSSLWAKQVGERADELAAMVESGQFLASGGAG